MRIIFTLVFIFFIQGCSKTLDLGLGGNNDTPDDGPIPSQEWQLIWNDEFDTGSLNSSKWEYQYGDGKMVGLPSGWGNNEEQYYTNSQDNLRVEIDTEDDGNDGSLLITSLANGYVPNQSELDDYAYNQSYDFTSARITSSEKFEFTYGRVEARIKFKSGFGLWHAFWLLGSDSSPYRVWPQKGEIDIMEAWKFDEGAFSSAAHFGSTGFHEFISKEFNGDIDSPFNYSDGEYHLYAIEWDATEIRWFIDGQHFFTLTKASYWNFYQDEENGWQGFIDKNSDGIDDNLEANNLSQYQDATDNAPFDQDQYIILNTAVNGTLGCELDSSNTPLRPCADPNGQEHLGEMFVDYVRVYQCPSDPLLPEGTGCKKYLDTQSQENYYSNSFFKTEYQSETSSFVTFNDIYIDGPGPEEILGASYLFDINNFISVSETNGVLQINSLPSGNELPKISFVRSDGELSILSGFSGSPQANGDVKFDLYINDFDPSSVVSGNEPIFKVGMSSQTELFNGFILFQNRSKVINLSDLAKNQWLRISVPISEIRNGSGSGVLDLKKLTELLFFEFNSNASLLIDNIQIGCGALPCGVVDEVPVFIDEVASIWTRGIRGNDSQQNSSLYENPDYDENDQHHVQWEFINTGEEGHDFVVQTTIGPEQGDILNGESTYPSQAVNFVGSIDAVSAIAGLRDTGEFRFDIKMINNPNDVDLYFKVDGGNCLDNINCTSTGEQPLGDLPINQWKTFSCAIENLAIQGLDVSTITAPFVMVPGISGTGKDVKFQWDNVLFSPIKLNASPTLNFPILFPPEEGGFCLPITPLVGGSFSLVVNPVQVGHLDSKVARTVKLDYGFTYASILLNMDQPVTFSSVSSGVNKLFRLKAMTPRDPTAIYFDPSATDGSSRQLGEMNVTFKLTQNQSGDYLGQGEDVERTFTLSNKDVWEDILIDFNGSGEGTYDQIQIIIDNGFRFNGSFIDWTLYFDDIYNEDSTSVLADLTDLNGNPNTPNLYTFDDQQTYYYPPPTGVDGARASIVIDPASSGRQRVGKVVYDVKESSTRGVSFLSSSAGLANPIPFDAGRTTIRIDVFTDEPNTEVLLKVEDSDNTFRNAVVSQFTQSSGWSTLDFDFGPEGIEYWETFEKLMIVFEPNECIRNPSLDPTCPNEPAQDEYFFDNIQLLP